MCTPSDDDLDEQTARRILELPDHWPRGLGLLCNRLVHRIADGVARARHDGERNARVLRCAFCGKDYPRDTPPTQSEALTEHIRTCAEHPMRKLLRRITEWEDLVGGIVMQLGRAKNASALAMASNDCKTRGLAYLFEHAERVVSCLGCHGGSVAHTCGVLDPVTL